MLLNLIKIIKKAIDSYSFSNMYSIFNKARKYIQLTKIVGLQKQTIITVLWFKFYIYYNIFMILF